MRIYDDIQKEFNKVLSYSQGVPLDKINTDDMFSKWWMNKKKFFDYFGGQYIYEVPEEITFNLSPEARHQRFEEFNAMVNDILYNENESSAEDFYYFLKDNEEGFYENNVVADWDWNGAKIKTGSKLVRSFKHFIENKKLLEDIQNSASRLIQEDKVTGKLCFSIHPLDFLSTSETTYNWRSCHALDGDYRSGNLGYMMDGCTIICYVRGEEETKLPRFPADVPWNSKKWRVLLFWSNDETLLFAGRQYPFASQSVLDDVLTKYMSMAGLGKLARYQKHKPDYWTPWTGDLIEECPVSGTGTTAKLRLPHIYLSPSAIKPLEAVIEDAPGSRHFNDLLESSCYKPLYSRAIWKKSMWAPDWAEVMSDSDTKLHIGARVKCICGCGKDVCDESSMMCYDDELAYGHSKNISGISNCYECGTRGDENDFIEGPDGEMYCQECYNKLFIHCPECGNWMRKDLYADKCPFCAIDNMLKNSKNSWNLVDSVDDFVSIPQEEGRYF